MPTDRLPQQGQKSEPVVRIAEDRLAIVAALDHMERDAGRKEAGLAGHATSITAAALASPSAQ
jgi:hypothetical protein